MIDTQMLCPAKLDPNLVFIPYLSSKASCGFPSPADDHCEETLDLNHLLVEHPAATFFLRAKGDSMIEAGIHDNDLLIVDRSLQPSHDKVVIAAIDGELTVKRLHLTGKKALLMPSNPNFAPIELKKENNIHFWGVVSYVIHALCCSKK